MLFSSEQVSNGHPDKICDQISDAIVTDILAHDKRARIAAECCIKDYSICILGEISTDYEPNYHGIIAEALRRIGLPDAEKYELNLLISRQSPDIARGVDVDGAGDQGMMFGYATNETKELLPIPYVLSTRALLKLREQNLAEGFSRLLPDAKAQVSYDYKAGRIDTVRPEHTPEAMNRPPRVDDHGGEVYVYRRAGQKCYICGTPISEQVMEGRNLFWCPTCQKGD